MVEGRVQRRLAAILAADVVGYSRLMEQDEVGTLARLKKRRKEVLEPIVATHQGRIFKFTGDGVLAEFSSAVNAVECAIDLQHAMASANRDRPEDRQIILRIGVNLGDVMVEGRDLYGDGVNISARLEQLAEPGGILVSGTAFDHAKNKVKAQFEDLGIQTVKNVTEPVRVYRVADTSPAPVESRSKSRDKPSIAVLPFVNMSGDAEQDYFADGISEDIITALSKLRWFFVIARNSSFVFKGKAVDVKRISRELGVRYILEGSVRKAASRVRITAQLIDAATGNHISADHYDGDLTDIFALQDEITKKVVGTIEPKLLEAEAIRSQRRSPDEFDAWDMVTQATSLFWRMTKRDSEVAIELLRKAVERYPDYPPAQSMLAASLLISGYMVSGFFDPHVAEAEALAVRAAELDNSDPWAHLALGYVSFIRRQTDAAVEEFQRALYLNPNFAAAHGYLGFALAFDGRSDEAIAHLNQAVIMSPYDPQNAIFNAGLAAAHYFAGRFIQAAGFARKAVQQRPGLGAVYRMYCASLAQAGEIDEAHAVLARLQEMQPELSIEWVKTYVPFTSGPMAKFIEGLSKAGLR